jgi:hypothetical protein
MPSFLAIRFSLRSEVDDKEGALSSEGSELTVRSNDRASAAVSTNKVHAGLQVVVRVIRVVR